MLRFWHRIPLRSEGWNVRFRNDADASASARARAVADTLALAEYELSEGSPMLIPNGFAGVTPYLFVEDASAYIGFLEAAFGAEQIGRSLTPTGQIANGQVRLSGATIMISEASAAFPPSQAALYLYVDDADDALDRAVLAGAEQIMEASDMSYGDRQAGVRDQAGTIWWISQRLTEEPYF